MTKTPFITADKLVESLQNFQHLSTFTMKKVFVKQRVQLMQPFRPTSWKWPYAACAARWTCPSPRRCCTPCGAWAMSWKTGRHEPAAAAPLATPTALLVAGHCRAWRGWGWSAWWSTSSQRPTSTNGRKRPCLQKEAVIRHLLTDGREHKGREMPGARTRRLPHRAWGYVAPGVPLDGVQVYAHTRNRNAGTVAAQATASRWGRRSVPTRGCCRSPCRWTSRPTVEQCADVVSHWKTRFYDKYQMASKGLRMG